MTKSVHDDVLDQALSFIENNTTVIRVCSTAAVTNYASATAKTLVSAIASAGDWTGPADGDTSGRKMTIGARNGVTARDTANATTLSVVLTQTSGQRVLYVTDVTASQQQLVVSGNSVNIGSWIVEILDPS